MRPRSWPRGRSRRRSSPSRAPKDADPIEVAGDAFAAASDEVELAEHVVRLALAATGAARCVLWRLEADAAPTLLAAGGGTDTSASRTVVLPLGEPPVAELELVLEDPAAVEALAPLGRPRRRGSAPRPPRRDRRAGAGTLRDDRGSPERGDRAPVALAHARDGRRADLRAVGERPRRHLPPHERRSRGRRVAGARRPARRDHRALARAGARAAANPRLPRRVRPTQRRAPRRARARARGLRRRPRARRAARRRGRRHRRARRLRARGPSARARGGDAADRAVGAARRRGAEREAPRGRDARRTRTARACSPRSAPPLAGCASCSRSRMRSRATSRSTRRSTRSPARWCRCSSSPRPRSACRPRAATPTSCGRSTSPSRRSRARSARSSSAATRRCSSRFARRARPSWSFRWRRPWSSSARSRSCGSIRGARSTRTRSRPPASSPHRPRWCSTTPASTSSRRTSRRRCSARSCRSTLRRRAASRSATCTTSSARVDVGGDVYDVLVLEDGRLAVCLGDVAGKGIQAVADMAMTKFAFRALARSYPEPGEFLAHVNDVVVEEIAPGKFVTMVYAVVDPEAGEIACASAGHPPPRIVSAERRRRGARLVRARARRRARPGVPGRARAARAGLERRPLHGRDDRVPARGRALRRGAPRRVPRRERGLEPQALADALVEDCRAFGGGELDDDCAVVCLRRSVG